MKWLKVEKKNETIHPVFLYSAYLEGMPVDIRMALLLETFEPIAEELHNRGIITLVKPPTRTFTNRCKIHTVFHSSHFLYLHLHDPLYF